MELERIQHFTHKHCRFKLRSGKEIFGVVWEVETSEMGAEGLPATPRLFFASVRDYERLQHEHSPVNVTPMLPEEIVAVESLAS
jgi:hypothetical protein